MRSPPRAQPQSPAATPLAYLSSTTTMPRVSFSLRPSLSRPLSPPWPARGLVFSGDVWLPNEPSFFSFGFGSKWTKISLVLWLDHIVDSASALPLLHLRLGDRTAVVVTGVHKYRAVTAQCGNACGATAEKHQTKKQIQLEVKAPEDVRRALLYHTAALSSTLSFYVDTDAERDHILDVMHDTLASLSSSPLLPSPPTRAATPPPAATPVPSADGAFAKLEVARATHQRGHVVDALVAYAAADKAFAAVGAPKNGDVGEATGSVQIFHARREIRVAIDALEKAKAQPRAAVAVSTTTVDVSEPTPAKSLDARLVGLQSFAHTRAVDRAQREHRVSSDDLTLRFHALRNENPTAPSTESLQQRLDRLRGPQSSMSARTASTPTTAQKLSPVDQIIQQAMDEVALGIVDDADEEGSASCSTRSSDSDSDSDDEPYGRGHRRRPHP